MFLQLCDRDTFSDIFNKNQVLRLQVGEDNFTVVHELHSSYYLPSKFLNMLGYKRGILVGRQDPINRSAEEGEDKAEMPIVLES